MPVFTAAVAAVGAAIAGATVATVATAAVAVGTAVATAGLGLNLVGQVTGSKDLQKIGGTMATVGGLGALVGGAVGGINALVGTTAPGTLSYADHVSGAWDAGVGKLFSEGPSVAQEMTGSTISTGPTSTLAVTDPAVPAGVTPPSMVRSQASLPPPRAPSTVPPVATAPPTSGGGIMEGITTSDKLALAAAGGQAIAGVGEGYFTGQAADRQAQLDQQRYEEGRPQADPNLPQADQGIMDYERPRGPAGRHPWMGRA